MKESVVPLVSSRQEVDNESLMTQVQYRFCFCSSKGNPTLRLSLILKSLPTFNVPFTFQIFSLRDYRDFFYEELRSLFERIKETKKGSFFSKQPSTANLAISANLQTFCHFSEKLSLRFNLK